MDEITPKNPALKTALAGFYIFAAAAAVSMSGQSAGICVAAAGAAAAALFYGLPLRRLSFSGARETLLLCFLACFAAASVFSVDPARSAGRCVLVFGDAAVCFLAGLVLTRQSEVKSFVRLLVLFAALESVYGIIQYFTGLRALNFGYTRDYILPHYRAFGTWDHYNALGGILGMILPLGFFAGLYGASRGEKYFYFSAAFITAACLVLTRCRGALLGSAAAFLLAALLSRRKAALLLLVVLVPALFANPASRKSLEAGFIRHYTDTNRIAIWKDALRTVRGRPLLGSGPSTFSGSLLKDRKEWRVRNEKLFYSHAHSIYLGLAAESGIPSVLFFTAFCAVLLVQSARKALVMPNGAMKGACLGFFCVVADFLVHGAGDYMLAGGTTYLFWAACGMLAFVLPGMTEP